MTTEIRLPFGRGYQTLNLQGADAELLECRMQTLRPTKPQTEIVAEAMAAPIGSEKLEKLAVGKKTACIIISDHTRPVPSKLILPPMLEALRCGNPDIEITLLVATGCHRGTTREELRNKLGEDILEHERIVVHDCDDAANMVELGILPSGQMLRVNRVACEAELLVAEGFIEPHFFAGFSGGRKSVLPGICARKTVMGNHNAQFIDDANARAGVLDGNPIHRDMEAAARMVNLRYVVNVILNDRKEVVAAVAGDAFEAHRAGCDILSAAARIHPSRKGDIVITTNGGAPLDQNLYQAVKSMTTAEAATAVCGTIIVCAECKDGVGGDMFYRKIAEAASPTALLAEIRKTPAEETVPDQWQYQIFARIAEQYRIIIVAGEHMRDTIGEMKIEYAATVGEAYETASKNYDDPHIIVIPDGVSAICE